MKCLLFRQKKTGKSGMVRKGSHNIFCLTERVIKKIFVVTII